ncbi:MAG: PepSY-associated TM helix domain-containing protein [Oceanicaulis sp.]
MVERTTHRAGAAPGSPGAASARPAAAAKPAKKRSIWWRLHQWAGLQMSLFLAFVFITGTLAVFSYEMDWMARPAMWAAPTAVEDRASWGAVSEAAAAHAPDAQVLNVYGPIHPASTFDVVMGSDDGPFHIYVHPRTGAVTGTGPWPGFQRFLRNGHRHLMIPVKWGVSLVTLAALFLAVSLVTSFWVYKKWWRGFLRLPQGRTARAFIGDLHRIAGVWSIWFVVLMVLTSFWYFIEQWGGAAPAANPARPADRVSIAEALPAAGSPGEAMDRAVAQLLAERPDFRIAQVYWPRGEDGLFQIQGYSNRAILVRPRANTVWADPATGAILGEVDPSALSLHVRIAEAADPLHFGTFGGYWTKTLWFVFGAVLSGLAITGVVIYTLRIAKQEKEAPRWRSGLVRTWRGMGRARWLAAALVILPFALAPVVL